MANTLELMLKKYKLETDLDKENAIKEIMQEIALAGLANTNFFTKAAFYGGTCLRIFYGLDRFSEDLDFALLNKDENFDLSNYFEPLKNEFNMYGINLDIEYITKKNSDVESAFISANTATLMLHFYHDNSEVKSIIHNQKIKIKFEIGMNNPPGGKVEFRYQTLPEPYEIQIFDESSLFAGKIHAILCRNYLHRVKGRDYFDYLFFISSGTKFNLQYLENKLKNTGGIIDSKEALTLDKVKELLYAKFSHVDYPLMVEDVSKFIPNKEQLKTYKKELFLSTLSELECT